MTYKHPKDFSETDWTVLELLANAEADAVLADLTSKMRTLLDVVRAHQDKVPAEVVRALLDYFNARADMEEQTRKSLDRISKTMEMLSATVTEAEKRSE